MTTSTLITIVILVIIIGIFICFPDSRVLLKGFIRLFFKDMAETPEGAEAIYEQSIHEMQERYNIASNAYRKASGELASEERALENLKKEFEKVSNECEKLVQAGRMEDAEIKVEQRSEIKSDIESSKQLVAAYKQQKAEAEVAFKHCEKKLRQLQKDKKDIIRNMRTKNELKKVYDDMEDLKRTTATDKLLDAVKDKNKDLNTEVEGARILHENKLSTKIDRANAAAKKTSDDEYLESLKRKYNK